MTLLCVAGLAVGMGQAASAVTFTSIDGPSATNFYGLPSINNNGEVAFERTDAISFASGIYRGTGGPLTTIAASTMPGMGAMVTHPSINGSGVVAFKAYQSSGNQGVYKGSGGALTLIDTIAAAYAMSSDARVSINNSGLVAYHKWTGDTAAGIYAGSGGAVTTIANSAGGVYTYSFGTLQMNDSGLVAFYAQPVGGGQGVFASTGQTLGADATQAIVSLNDLGRAVFQSSAALYTNTPGGSPTLYLDSSGPFSIGPAASINNLNQIAFMAGVGTQVGIYYGPDPVANRLIQQGDSLFGGTVANVGIWDEALNDNGDIAFVYALTDGRQGVAVGHIPAPSALGVLGLAGLMAARRRR